MEALSLVPLSVVLKVVFEKATTYAQQQFVGVTAELKQSIEQLQTTLLIVNGMISDAENRLGRGGNANLEAWLANLRGVVYSADDVFDQMEYKRLEQRVMNGGNRAAVSLRYVIMKQNPFTSRIPSFVAKIKEIQGRMDKVLTVANYFKLEMVAEQLRPVNHDHSRWRMTSPNLFDDENNIISRDKEKADIIDLLLDKVSINVSSIQTEPSGRNRVSVIAIIGIGGLGKTTLAQLIFQDKEVKNHFEFKIWVCVSDDFNVERIIHDILKFISVTYDERQDLREQLKNAVKDKKFLLVLDDIWNDDIYKWNDLVKQFDVGKEGSKILITCRNERFTPKISQLKLVRLAAFSDEDLTSLLMKHALWGENNHGLQGIGIDIAKKLKGLPLAAKTIGRILSSDLSVSHWNSILESELWDLPQNEDDIMPALQLSYTHLPAYLKPCFAFCSVFPKDFQYTKRDIIFMWIALGLVQQSRGTSKLLEDIGNNYVNELLNLSMFEPCKDDTDKFVIHDLIHDMANMVSKDEILILQGENSMDQINNTIHNVRHLAVYTEGLNWESLENFPSLSNLRCLVFFQGFKNSSSFNAQFPSPEKIEVFMKKILSKVRSLRILDLSRLGVNYIPNSFSKLQCLRYLNLPHTNVKELPSSIYKLYHLQTLRIEGDYVEKWPHRLNNLANLRHICRGSKYSLTKFSERMIARLNKLKSLQELEVQLSAKDGREIRALKDMKQMQNLYIRGPEYVKRKEDAIGAGLRQMKHLKRLKLHWFFQENSDKEVLEGLQPNVNLESLSIRGCSGVKSPNWLENLYVSNLQKISLKDCDTWEVLPALGQIPCLKSLKLREMKKLREFAPDFFCQNSCMSYISIGDCPELKFIFPWLPPMVSTLELWKCPNIGRASTTSPIISLEDWLPPTLKKLVLSCCGILSDMLVAAHLEKLVCMEHLELYGCDSIKFLPPSCSAHLQYLILYRCHSFEILLTNAMKILTYLNIEDCPKLLFNLLILGVGIPSSLTNLQLKREGFYLKLSSGSCGIFGHEPSQLKACLQGLRNNESVTRLYIHSFRDVELFDADMNDNLLGLKSLEELCIHGLADLRSLPEKLRHMSALTQLRISFCPKVDALPGGGVPSSLRILDIWECPELAERFSEEKHKVSHVTIVRVQGSCTT